MPKFLIKSHKIRALLFYPLYLISKIVKRDERLWLFAPMNHAFLDNAKYLFLHVVQNHPQIKAYFITEKDDLLQQLQKKNLPVVQKWSWKGFYYGLKAKWYIISAYVDDVNYWTSGGAKVFNLWHGIPLKKIEFDITSGPLAKRYHKRDWYSRIFKPYFYRKPDFVLSTSSEVSRLFATAFRIDARQCPVLGYPRTDIFFKGHEQILKHIEKFESGDLRNLIEQMAHFKRVLLYMPTWRDDRSDFLKAAFPDTQKLNELLKKNNTLFLLKLHPNDISLRTFQEMSHLKSLSAKMDLYPVLPFTDGLITDYSSIYFDYMLLKKPILFYAFDLEAYLKNREMYFDYASAVPGPIVKNFDELLKTLNHWQNLQVDEKYLSLLKRFWKYQDGNSSQRVVEFLTGKLDFN